MAGKRIGPQAEGDDRNPNAFEKLVDAIKGEDRELHPQKILHRKQEMRTRLVDAIRQFRRKRIFPGVGQVWHLGRRTEQNFQNRIRNVSVSDIAAPKPVLRRPQTAQYLRSRLPSLREAGIENKQLVRIQSRNPPCQSRSLMPAHFIRKPLPKFTPIAQEKAHFCSNSSVVKSPRPDKTPP